LILGIAPSSDSADMARFRLSPSQLDAVLQYVEEQLAHHRTRTFQEKYRELLRKHGVEFDERYVWD
jgi:mono/diheme cytochrome c family protein